MSTKLIKSSQLIVDNNIQCSSLSRAATETGPRGTGTQPGCTTTRLSRISRGAAHESKCVYVSTTHRKSSQFTPAPGHRLSVAFRSRESGPSRRAIHQRPLIPTSRPAISQKQSEVCCLHVARNLHNSNPGRHNTPPAHEQPGCFAQNGNVSTCLQNRENLHN